MVLARTWHCRSQDVCDHLTLQPLCHDRQTRPVCALLASHKLESLLAHFCLFLGQRMESKKDGLIPTFTMSNLTAMGTPTQEMSS